MGAGAGGLARIPIAACADDIGDSLGRERLTSHVRLKVSKSTNSRDTVSSVRFDLYCFSSRLHVSVYSDSVTESLM